MEYITGKKLDEIIEQNNLIISQNQAIGNMLDALLSGKEKPKVKAKKKKEIKEEPEEDEEEDIENYLEE